MYPPTKIAQTGEVDLQKIAKEHGIHMHAVDACMREAAAILSFRFHVITKNQTNYITFQNPPTEDNYKRDKGYFLYLYGGKECTRDAKIGHLLRQYNGSTMTDEVAGEIKSKIIALLDSEYDW